MLYRPILFGTRRTFAEWKTEHKNRFQLKRTNKLLMNEKIDYWKSKDEECSC